LLCVDLRQALSKNGSHALWCAQLLNSSAKLVWRFDSRQSSSSVWVDNQTKVSENDIAGVVLRKPLSFSAALAATQSETYLDAERAIALLSWLWSLRCPVINRYRPEFWFEPTESLDFWSGRLERFGLKSANPGDISEESRLREVNSEAGPEKTPYLVAVVGSRIIWDQGAPGRLRFIDDSLIRFTGSIGLTYLEYRIVNSSSGPRVASVEPFPKYDQFCATSRLNIISELVKLLTRSENQRSIGTDCDSWF